METLQIVILCAALLFIAVVAYRALHKKVVSKEIQWNNRMLVAVRRRGAALDHYLKLSSDEKIELFHSLEKLSHILHERWLAGAQYVGGFCGDVQGLPASGEYEWMIIAIYAVSDYQHFQNCIALLKEPQFETLRYHLEIRFIFGSSIKDMSKKMAKLF